jgi:hypothetical protein
VRQPGDTRLRVSDWNQRQRHGLAILCHQCLAQPLDAALLPVPGAGVSRTEVNLHKWAIEEV